jgi:hypothetical protein
MRSEDGIWKPTEHATLDNWTAQGMRLMCRTCRSAVQWWWRRKR